jgi:hypothetical protein
VNAWCIGKSTTPVSGEKDAGAPPFQSIRDAEQKQEAGEMSKWNPSQNSLYREFILLKISNNAFIPQ